jgi:ureidoacrylate peracid hydrolase
VVAQDLRVRDVGRRAPPRIRTATRRCQGLGHWCSSGFANTDLDLQLKKHGIDKLIVIGLIAHTCVEATVRFAAELGYEVTLVKDATADYSDEEMHAALDVNIPN